MLKIIKAGETVTYLGREHTITEVTEQGVKLKRVNALPNEYSIYIRKGSDRFFKIFSNEFDVEDIETTEDDGIDVSLEKPEKSQLQETDEEEDDDSYIGLNDFIVNLTKKYTDFATKEEVTEYLRAELFDENDELNSLKRFTISCWLNRRVLVKFQTEDIDKYLSKVKRRPLRYTDELRLFIESAIGDITEPSDKELRSLVSLIPREDEELILNIIKGFDFPLLWLNQTEVKQMLKEADEAFHNRNNTNKTNKTNETKKDVFMKTIKNLSDTTIAEMNELFANEAKARGLNEDVAETDEDDEEIEEEIDLEAMNLKELKAYCKEEGIDIAGLKTKDEIIEAILDAEEEIEEDEEDEEDEIDEDETEDVAEEDEEDEEDEEEEDEEDDDEYVEAEEFVAYTDEELEEMTLKELREVAGDYFEIEGANKMKKPALIEVIREAQEELAEEEEDEEEEEAYTKEELEEMTLKDLREIADEDFGVGNADIMKKPALIKAILEAQELGDEEEEDGEDEIEEDEMPDYASMSLAELRAECKKEGIPTKGLKKPALIKELEALFE